MRDQVTTTIDPFLKQVYESLKNRIGKTYRQILEEGIRKEVEKCDPIPLLRHDIARTDLEQEERRQTLSRLEFSQSQIKEKTPVADMSENTVELENIRELQFLKEPKYILRLYKEGLLDLSWKQGGINWERIVPLYRFKDKEDGVKWLSARAEKYLKEKQEVRTRTK